MADEYIDKIEVGAKIQVKCIRREMDYGGENDFCRGMRKALRVIENMPAADVQPVKHGRWENEHIEDDEAWWADCTNCKNETHSKYGRVSFYAFCPNCGARMIKEE